MRLTLRLSANLVLTTSLLIGGPAAAQQDITPPETERPSFWQAVAGIVAVNGLTWLYNWHVQRWDWANVGTRSWWANLRGGFDWDDDAFGANQVAHPYHGSLYFNSARASGHGFWGSTPYVAVGSLTWELFTENVRPSLNDLINTTVGGIALGEVSYRMSALLAGKGGAGSRQLGAFVASPVARTHSLVHGRHDRQSYSPESSSALLAIGQSRSGGTAPSDYSVNRPFVGLTFQYGSAFDESVRRPYDAFQFSLQLSPNQFVVLTHASVSGLLARHQLIRSPRSQVLVGLFQHYDYDDLPFAKASSQSLSAALLYRQGSSRRTQLDLGVHLEAVPLGAVSSDYHSVRRRDYDFGPGLGGRFTAALRHDGQDLLSLNARTVWIHSVYAADADHVTTTARVSAAVPVMGMVSVGGDFGLTVRRSFYRSRLPVTRRFPEFRAYLIWSTS